jgi:hypothetical protein
MTRDDYVRLGMTRGDKGRLGMIRDAHNMNTK